MKKDLVFNSLAALTILVFGIGIDALLEQYTPANWFDYLRYGVGCYAYGVMFVYFLYKTIWREK